MSTERCSSKERPLEHARDLVKLIKRQFGDFFSVGVAAYPEGHPEASSGFEDLQHLREKIEAGADFVVSQVFYDVKYFLDFVKQARNIGITVPIIPGIMPIVTYDGLLKMTALCKVQVSTDILQRLEHMNEAQVRLYGIELAVNMCRDLIRQGVTSLHFYTLNLDFSAAEILAKLQM